MKYTVRVKSVSIAEYEVEAVSADDAAQDYEMGELLEVEPFEEIVMSASPKVA